MFSMRSDLMSAFPAPRTRNGEIEFLWLLCPNLPAPEIQDNPVAIRSASSPEVDK